MVADDDMAAAIADRPAWRVTAEHAAAYEPDNMIRGRVARVTDRDGRRRYRAVYVTTSGVPERSTLHRNPHEALAWVERAVELLGGASGEGRPSPAAPPGADGVGVARA